MKMVMLILMMMVAGPPHRKGGLDEDCDVGADDDGDDVYIHICTHISWPASHTERAAGLWPAPHKGKAA